MGSIMKKYSIQLVISLTVFVHTSISSSYAAALIQEAGTDYLAIQGEAADQVLNPDEADDLRYNVVTGAPESPTQIWSVVSDSAALDGYARQAPPSTHRQTFNKALQESNAVFPVIFTSAGTYQCYMRVRNDGTPDNGSTGLNDATLDSLVMGEEPPELDCVENMSELNAAIAAAQPGDTIYMSTGVWNNVSIDFDADGLPGQPITLRAQVDGKVTLEGSSKLQIAGDYLVVRGLHFTNGSISSGHVIEFRNGTSSSDYANNSRLTECAITDYNPTDPTTNYKWVSVYGFSNRVDHCAFTGMNHIGVTLTVWLLNLNEQANRTRIDNNLFANRAEGDGNEYETIRIGTSTRSLWDSEAIVESNYFFRCDGEIEIISNKSCKNIYRRNTFEDCKGQLTLRHGNACLVEGNFFFGNGNTSASGVRIIGEDHVVVNNYFENLRGTSWSAALAMMNGIPDSPLNKYFQVKRAVVAFNTFYGCADNFVIGIASGDGSTTLPPQDCVIANNVVQGSDAPLIEYRNTPINMQYEGNIFYGASLGITKPAGIAIMDPLLSLSADGLMRPATTSPVIDSAVGSDSEVLADMDGDLRVPGTQDIGADEVTAGPVPRAPAGKDNVGPRWMRPGCIAIDMQNHGSDQ
jgi:poly(beta-D-mannuronate) lyase